MSKKQDDIDKDLSPTQGAAVEAISDDDKDTLGEIGNIFMGSASTTLSMLLNQKVEITAPIIELFDTPDDSYMMKEDYITVEINYIEGLEGVILLALKQKDASIIADLMMGGMGKESDDIGEIQLSAVSEAMNQMVGSASTSLSNMLNHTVNISPPILKKFEKNKKMDLDDVLEGKPIVSIKFNLTIGTLINSEIFQFIPIISAKAQITSVQDIMKNLAENLGDNRSQSMVDSLVQQEQPNQPSPMADENFIAQAFATPPSSYGPPPPPPPQKQVTVQPVEFASFDNAARISGGVNQNLNLVMDVNLGLSVELGRAELPIKDVLELTKGSIIELNKIAGEPVELYANGKLIAKGEVVVIEDNFGLRITSIISPEQRIKHI
jgi:flagellar motor switch protein FliN/FliY